MTTISDFKAMGEAAGSLASGMAGLGGDELAQTVAKASAAINMVSGVVQVASLAVTLMQRENLKDASEAVATASAMAFVPVVGWTNVAAATVASAAVGATLGAVLTYKLRGDLSSPSGRTSIAQMAGGLA
jgi:hypothetical protein